MKVKNKGDVFGQEPRIEAFDERRIKGDPLPLVSAF